MLDHPTKLGKKVIQFVAVEVFKIIIRMVKFY